MEYIVSTISGNASISLHHFYPRLARQYLFVTDLGISFNDLGDVIVIPTAVSGKFARYHRPNAMYRDMKVWQKAMEVASAPELSSPSRRLVTYVLTRLACKVNLLSCLT
jgi:hypothetical protein